MGCKPTYKGIRYNSLEELYNANGVNEQQKQQAQQLYSQYIEQTGKQDIEGFKEFALEQMVKNPVGVQRSVDFSTMDLTKKYFTPHSIDKFGVNSNMGYYYDSNASNRALMESVKKFRGRAAVTKMIQKMSTFASGMNIIAETGDSSMRQGYGKTKGWIDSKGIHINTELVTPDTYVHELTHIWLHWLRMTDTDAYNRVLEMAQVHMNEHNGLVELLSSEYNPNTREFLDEYISTVAGLYSYESVVNMLSEEGIFDSYDEASKHFKEMRDLSREIYGEISPIFEGVAPSVRELDLSVSTFTDVLESLVSDFKANRSVFSEQEGKSIMDDIITSIYGGKSPYRSYDFDTLPPINTVKDIASYLARKNLDDTSQGVFIKNNRDRALYLANMANTRLDKYGNKEKYIIIGEKTYTFDSSSSIVEDANYIEKEIISKIDNYRMEVQAGFENMLANYDPFNDSDTSLENYAKKYKLNYYSLAKMIENTGIYHGNGTIMKYSDLKNNEKYSYLFNEAFVGFDPYVVIKEIDDKPVLSFMEMSPERLKSMSKDLDGNNLLGSLGINDYNYSLSGGTLKNNSGGIKLAVMGLSALYAASKGAKIETVSIFSTPNSNMDSMVIYDINELFTDLQILSRQEQFVNNIANKEIKALFNQQDIFDKDHGSSWLNRLRQYIETKEAAYYKKSQLGNLFFGTEVTNAEFKDAIRARMRVLENKNGNAKRSYYDKEYQLLSAAYAELDGIQKGFMKSIKDVKWWQRSIIPTHYQPEFVQQYMKEAYDKSKFVIYDEVREFQQRNKKLRQAVYRRGRAQHVGSASKALLFDASSDIFSHLFQKRDVFVMENGKKVKRQETIPWLLHYDKNDDNTKRALANRTITEEDLEYTQMVIKEMKDRAIRNLMHQKHMANNDISYDEAEKIYNDIIGIKGDGLFMNNIRNGAFVPIIQKNTTESLISALTSGMKKEDLQQWWKRANEEVFNSEELFIDALSVHSKDNTLSDRFHRQLISFGDTLSESGIEIGDKGEIVIVDYNKFKGISTNIEMGSNYFMLSSARKEYYEKYFIPAYNSYFAILELYKEEHNIDSELEGLKRWAKEWKALNIDRKPLHTRDTNPASMALIKLESIVTRAFSNAVLGLSVPIGVRSHVYNNLKGTIEVVARSIAEKRLQDNKLNMFDGVTWAKATRDMYSNKDYKKTWALARKLQVIDGTERDLIENPVNVMSKRYALQEQSLHFMNWGTDNFARTTALRAQMYFEGSWDAYSYNEKTGELEYDWRKDKRWVTKEGKVKDEGTAIRRMIYDNNNELGLDQNEFDKMSLGHDPKLASQMKYYADTYIIGTFSSDAKSLFSSRAGGKSISQFRNFAGSRMFQAGFGGSIKTVLGGGYKAIQGEDGNWIAEPEVRDYEGTAQSFMGFAKALLNMRNQSMTEWWNSSHGARRTNLVKMGVKAGTLAVLIMIMALMKPEDDEWGEYYKRMRRRYKWLMTDMIDFYTMIEIYESPIPYVRAFNDMYDIAFNDADWTRVFKYVPVGNTMSKYGVFDKEEDEEE